MFLSLDNYTVSTTSPYLHFPVAIEIERKEPSEDRSQRNINHPRFLPHISQPGQARIFALASHLGSILTWLNFNSSSARRRCKSGYLDPYLIEKLLSWDNKNISLLLWEGKGAEAPPAQRFLPTTSWFVEILVLYHLVRAYTFTFQFSSPSLGSSYAGMWRKFEATGSN